MYFYIFKYIHVIYRDYGINLGNIFLILLKEFLGRVEINTEDKYGIYQLFVKSDKIF